MKEADEDAEIPIKYVTFSTSKNIGGSLTNYSGAEGYQTFSSAPIIGKQKEDSGSSELEEYFDEEQVTFRSGKQVGRYDQLSDDQENDESQWVLWEDSNAEEDWAVMNATLITFFLTMLFFLIVGLLLGKYCCKKVFGNNSGR